MSNTILHEEICAERDRLRAEVEALRVERDEARDELAAVVKGKDVLADALCKVLGMSPSTLTKAVSEAVARLTTALRSAPPGEEARISAAIEADAALAMRLREENTRLNERVEHLNRDRAELAQERGAAIVENTRLSVCVGCDKPSPTKQCLRCTEDVIARAVAKLEGENTRLLLLLRTVVDRDTTRSADGTVTNCLRCDTVVADGPKARPHGKTWNGKPCDVGDLTAALAPASDNATFRQPKGSP